MADAGLFGPSPWEVQQAQNAGLQQQAQAYARMSPMERAAAGMYQAGGMLTGVAADKLGGVNVPRQMAQDTTDIQKQIDHSTSEGLIKGAQLLKDVNPKLAMQYVQAAQAMKEKEASIGLKNAQAQRALREPSFRDYEYQQMMEILNDPDSTDDMKRQAQARIDALNAKAGGKNNSGSAQIIKVVDPASGVVQMIRTEKGIGGKSEVISIDGKPLTPAEYSPAVKAQLSQATAGGKVIGEESAKATVSLIDAEPTAEMQLKQLEKLLNHPGLSQAVGVGLPGAKNIPGSKEADFAALFDQVQGGVFLQAFNSLRGGGQITDAEGKKATAALLRAQYTNSEAEFKAAVREYMGYIRTGLDRLRKKSQLSTGQSSPAAPAPTAAPTFYRTPNEVRDAYRSGKMTKAEANAMLDAMKKEGVQF